MFVGNIKAEWLESDSARRMRLLAPVAYIDPHGKQWPVPEGAEVDGASIPRAFWTFIGSPFVGEYRKASVVHDYYCDTKTESWQDTHRMFYHACLAGGAKPSQAKIMFTAVFLKGPRWGYGFSDPLAGIDDQEVDELIAWTENNDPSLAEIEARIMEQAAQ